MSEKQLKVLTWVVIAVAVVSVVVGIIVYNVHQAADVDNLSRNLHF